MKLTKGKLSKLYNKKKQSLKRYKKGGKTYKSKTFRKRKALNLHTTSLKKHRGGQAKPETDPVPGQTSEVNSNTEVSNTHDVASASSLAETQPSPSAQDPSQIEIPYNTSGSAAPLPNQEEQPLNSQEEQPLNSQEEQPLPNQEEQAPLPNQEEQAPLPNQEEQPLPNQEEPPLPNQEDTPLPSQEEQPLNSQEETPLPNQEDTPLPGQEPVAENNANEPGSNDALPAPVSEEGVSNPEATNNSLEGSNAEPAPVSNPEAINNSLEGSNYGSDAADPNENLNTTTSEPLISNSSTPNSTPSNNNNDISIVAESLDKLADYISEKIAQKLRNSNSNGQNDAFKAVANASGTFAGQ